jgi:hypothetical protein
MTAMSRVHQPAGTTARAPAVRRGSRQGSVLALQRSIGNQAVKQLLQRQPTIEERLSTIAKGLKAADLIDDVKAAGVEPGDIHKPLHVKPADVGSDSGLRPGLNIAGAIPGGAGETGFVGPDCDRADCDATPHKPGCHCNYLGDSLPANAPDPLPRIAIAISASMFAQGDDAVRETLRHELEHATHAQKLLTTQAAWRASLKKAGKPVPKSPGAAERDMLAFAKRQKLTDAELALLTGYTEGKTFDTELLAYLQGFMEAFPNTPPPSPAVFKTTMPIAIEQLRGAADHAWSAADDSVKTLARDRLGTFYGGLAADKQALLRDWLFYLHYRAGTKWAATAKDPEATAANYVYGAFNRHLKYLEWLLDIIGEKEFAAHKLSAPTNQSKVTGITLPKESKAVKVGSGVAKVFVEAQYTFGSQSSKHGISLSYDGPDAGDMRWLQFIWREVVPDGGKGVPGKTVHQAKEYPLTTEPSEPSQIGWNVDSATYIGGPESAFMQMDAAVNRTAGHLQIFDEPSGPYPEHVKQAFQATGSGGGGVTGRAHLVQFLVRGREVLLRAEETFEYRYDNAKDNPEGKPSFVSAKPASAIDPGARDRLHQMYKELDYLP